MATDGSIIFINGNYEIIESLQDISRIIRTHYSYDLANRLDDLIPEHTDADYYELEAELRELEDEIADLENNY